jgi:hypothetical protein
MSQAGGGVELNRPPQLGLVERERYAAKLISDRLVVAIGLCARNLQVMLDCPQQSHVAVLRDRECWLWVGHHVASGLSNYAQDEPCRVRRCLTVAVEVAGTVQQWLKLVCVDEQCCVLDTVVQAFKQCCRHCFCRL